MADSRPYSDERLRTMSAEELEAEIRHHNHLYWDLQQPVISDYEYDRLTERLKAVRPTSPVLEELGPTEVGRAEGEVRHTRPMLSLDKCYADEDLQSWASKFEGDVLVMPKMDGIAASLRYDDRGRLTLAATRGSGIVGDDVTRNARTIEKLPLEVDLPGIEVRGEIYMRLSVFATFAEQFSNPRNLAAGAIKHKNPQRCRDYRLSFAAYDLLDHSSTEEEKMGRLAQLGFQTVDWKIAGRGELRATYEELAARRQDLDYEIDGVVFRANRVDEQIRLGSTAHHPRYAIAYKFQGDSGASTLRRVEWSVARSGAITPVAHIDPVTLSGAQVSRASLHNAGFVSKLGLLHQPPGAKLVVTRRGGVIPKVEFVAEPAPPDAPGERIELPHACPSCGGPVRQQRDFVYCARPERCRDATISAIAHYCAALDILGFGDKLLAQCYDQGLLRSPTDLYQLTEEKLLGLERVGPKLAAKLVKEIGDRRRVRLATFLRALGIDELGRHVSEILEREFRTLERIREKTAEELAAIPTIGPEISASVVRGLREKSDLIDALLSQVTLFSEENAAAQTAGGPLSGRSFVFTGTLHAMDRKAAQAQVEELGGQAPSGVTRDLTYLVLGEEAGGRKSSKQVKAEKYISEGAALRVISEAEFLELLREKR